MIKILPSLHESSDMLEASLVGCGCGCGGMSDDWKAGFAAGIEQS